MIKIIIPDYPDKVLIAKARRAKYYTDGSKLPTRYLNSKYEFNEFDRLYNTETGETILANPRTAGKPRYWVVNFQDIWNQNMTKQNRASRIDKLKDVLRPYIKAIKKIKTFPIEMSITIFDITCPVDISNRGAIYTKVIEDLLVKEGRIPDDSIEYINCSGRTKFIQVENSAEKRMEVRITKSNNKP